MKYLNKNKTLTTTHLEVQSEVLEGVGALGECAKAFFFVKVGKIRVQVGMVQFYLRKEDKIPRRYQDWASKKWMIQHARVV